METIEAKPNEVPMGFGVRFAGFFASTFATISVMVFLA
jgi:hypothetical protein